jgi:hypothetical protein
MLKRLAKTDDDGGQRHNHRAAWTNSNSLKNAKEIAMHFWAEASGVDIVFCTVFNYSGCGAARCLAR